MGVGSVEGLRVVGAVRAVWAVRAVRAVGAVLGGGGLGTHWKPLNLHKDFTQPEPRAEGGEQWGWTKR